MYLEISSQAVAEKKLGCFCFVLFFNKQKPKTKKKTKLGYSSSKWNNPLKSFKENTFKSIFKISHYLRRCSAFCPCSSRGSLKKKKQDGHVCQKPSYFSKAFRTAVLDQKQPDLWHHRSFIIDASILHLQGGCTQCGLGCWTAFSVDLEKKLPKSFSKATLTEKI